MDAGLKEAIEAAGSQAKLARRLGLTRQTICEWDRIPAHHVVAVEIATGVPRERLRPELYRKSSFYALGYRKRYPS